MILKVVHIALVTSLVKLIMAQPRKAIRLIHAPKGFCDVMIHANIALNNGEFGEAINHYTEVLYKLAPAHVCAFLNRSMAFLKIGYHELAVVDAYRACGAANDLRKVRFPQMTHRFRDLSLSYEDTLPFKLAL